MSGAGAELTAEIAARVESFGVRPNSPSAVTMVEPSIPRSSRSSISVATELSHSGNRFEQALNRSA